MLPDYLAVGLDPSKSTIFIQSQTPELRAVHVLMNLVSPAHLERTDSKTEIAQKVWYIPTGFLVYPLRKQQIQYQG